jgi:hypothetical protein
VVVVVVVVGGKVVVVVAGGNVVVVVGGKVVVVVAGGNVVVVVGGKVVVVVAGGNVVVVVGGSVVVVVVTTGSKSPIPDGAGSVLPVGEQSPRAYVGTATAVQPGWVLAFISVKLLEPVESASELAFTTATAWIRFEILPDGSSQRALP